MKVKQETPGIDSEIVVLDGRIRWISSCITAARVVRRSDGGPRPVRLFVLYSGYSRVHGKPDKIVPPDCMSDEDIAVVQAIYAVGEFGRFVRGSIVETVQPGTITSFGVFLDNLTFVDDEWVEAFGIEVFSRAVVRMMARACRGAPKVFFDDVDIYQLAFHVNNGLLEVVSVAVHRCILYTETDAGAVASSTLYVTSKPSENLHVRQFRGLLSALQRAGMKITEDDLFRWYIDEMVAAGAFENKEALLIVQPDPGQVKIKKEQMYYFRSATRSSISAPGRTSTSMHTPRYGAFATHTCHLPAASGRKNVPSSAAYVVLPSVVSDGTVFIM